MCEGDALMNFRFIIMRGLISVGIYWIIYAVWGAKIIKYSKHFQENLKENIKKYKQ